jgi:RNA polymerase sigma-70 factor (ECF subfamily)
MVESLRAGKEKAYAKLFEEYYRPLAVFANKYLNDLESSKELVQDLFVSIYENRKTQVITTSLRSYLYQSVRNRCLNQLKKEGVRREYEKNARQSGTSNDSLEDQIHANELEHQIFQILSRLSPKGREVFIMSRVDGLRNQEIAHKLEISIRTVETHISNVLKELRQRLGEEYNF